MRNAFVKMNIATASILLFACLQPIALAEPGRPRSLAAVELNAERECELEVDVEEEIVFECKSETDGTNVEGLEIELEDKIKFHVSVDNEYGLKIKIEYERETEAEDEALDSEIDFETETSYEVVFDRVVEYRTTEKDKAYDWDGSTVVSELALTNFGSFSQIGNYTASTYVFSVTSMDQMATFTFTISEGRDDGPLTANKMKIDFELKNYGWVGPQDETQYTYVALLARIESEREVESDYEDSSGLLPEDVKILFGSDRDGLQPFGEFTWAKEALSLVEDVAIDQTNEVVMSRENTATVDVIATAPGDKSNRIAFSFVGDAASGSADLYWDPEAGVGYSTGSGVGSALTSLTMAVLGFALVSLL